MDSTEQKTQPRGITIKLWPPTPNTRSMLVQRMVHNLSTPSLFTRKYGNLSEEEAIENAKQMEDTAFATANQHYENEPDGDGASAVQLYAKECSKLILNVLKGGGYRVPNRESRENLTFFDISKGDRAFIEPEETEELLKPLKEPGNMYTKIRFSNRSFSLPAARIADPILASLKDQLKDLDLSDFIAGRAEEEALEVMKVFSSALEGCVLRSLNLSDNALGEKGIRAFAPLLKSQHSLEELYLMNDGISEEAAQALRELIPSTQNLAVLQFHSNMTGDEGAKAISAIVKESPLLESFQCSSTRVDSEGGVAISEALESCPRLKKLDLRDNMFGVAAGVALSNALLNQVNLVEIYLSYLNLEDEGAIAIADALRESAPLLEVLDMSGNDISAKAAPALGGCIERKRCLGRVLLAENELRDEGAICVGKALEGLEELREVDLSTNFIRRGGARVLAQVVVKKRGFKLLSMNANFISEEGIDELRDMFDECPSMLGDLDENDPEGEEDKESVEDDDEDGANELVSGLKKLDVNIEG